MLLCINFCLKKKKKTKRDVSVNEVAEERKNDEDYRLGQLPNPWYDPHKHWEILTLKYKTDGKATHKKKQLLYYYYYLGRWGKI